MGFNFERSPRPVANLKANDNQYVTDGTNNTPVKYHTKLIDNRHCQSFEDMVKSLYM